MKKVLLAVAAVACAIPARAEVLPRDLKCEYKVNPIGIGETAPRLSWIVDSKSRAEKQTAYQIRVASSLKNLQSKRVDLWDSGTVKSGATAQIAYAGKPLSSAQQVWRQVRSWDKDRKASAFSAPARWMMGLVNPAQAWIGRDALPGQEKVETFSLTKANWIWFSKGNPVESAPVATRYFRSVINVPADHRHIAPASQTICKNY